ncbi:MAG: ankyrin repeat domain-containing protein [bacterium]|nr:ankyrin repeat domain-containing protein [bacterium]
MPGFFSARKERQETERTEELRALASNSQNPEELRRIVETESDEIAVNEALSRMGESDRAKLVVSCQDQAKRMRVLETIFSPDLLGQIACSKADLDTRRAAVTQIRAKNQDLLESVPRFAEAKYRYDLDCWKQDVQLAEEKHRVRLEEYQETLDRREQEMQGEWAVWGDTKRPIACPFCSAVNGFKEFSYETMAVLDPDPDNVMAFLMTPKAWPKMCPACGEKFEGTLDTQRSIRSGTEIYLWRQEGRAKTPKPKKPKLRTPNKPKSPALLATSLVQAISSGDVKAVGSWLQRYPELAHADSDNEPAFRWCLREEARGKQQSLQIAHLFILQAIARGDIEVVRPMLAGYPQLTDATFQGSLPIHTALTKKASENRHGPQIARLLVPSKEKVNSLNPHGHSALHLCCIFGDESVAESLVSAGADVNILCPKDGSTPLHLAVISDEDDLVQFLLRKGAEINTREAKYGMTPLHCAVAQGNPDLTSLLLSNGADPSLRENQGRTPLELARQLDQPECEQVLG